MQQQHQGGGGGGGSQFGGPPPDMGPFSPTAAATGGGPMPLSSRPPSSAQPQPQPQQPRTSYDELAVVSAAGAAAAGFDDEMMGGGSGGGGGGGSSGASSNRWPREETQALIRIRSEMDATFRDATLKGPLWEDVSRRTTFYRCRSLHAGAAKLMTWRRGQTELALPRHSWRSRKGLPLHRSRSGNGPSPDHGAARESLLGHV